MRACLTAIASVALLSGCNTLSDYWRRPADGKDLVGQEDLNAPVRAMSLDSSRRLVISHDRAFRIDERTGRYFTCPEPPPDVALSTLSESIAGLNSRTGDSAQIADSYKAVALAVSARTSTVEIWRTTTSAYCILLMNGRALEADALLAASLFALQKTSDSQPVNAIQGDISSTLLKRVEEQAKQLETISTQNRAENLRLRLELAKVKCERVPEADRKTHADCKLRDELTAQVAALSGRAPAASGGSGGAAPAQAAADKKAGT